MNLSFRGCLRPLLCGLVAFTGLGLGACNNAINTGVAPLSLTLTKPGTATVVNTLQMYECLTSGLSAIMYFSNGSAGNFTDRVVWSSSNSGTVEVSNGDIQIPGTTSFYPAGTLVPQHSGSAIITGNYYGIISQTSVTVSVPAYFKMQAIIQGLRTPLNLVNDPYKTGSNPSGSADSFSIGAGTTLQLSVVANLDGVETDVSSFGTWNFLDAGTNPGATINPTTGLITAGNNPAQPLTPTVTFPSCPSQLVTALQQYTMAVSPVQSIVLSPEFNPGTPATPTTPANPTTMATLYPSNEERINVIATLQDGTLQDVSSQSTLSISGGSNNMVFISNGAGAVNILEAEASAGGTGNAVISGNFTPSGVNLPSQQISVVANPAQLIDFYICWSSPYVAFSPTTCTQQQGGTNQPNAQVVAGSLTPVQYHTVGNFGSIANPLWQEITRVTTWSAATTNATISTGAATVGQALGVSNGLDQITATALTSGSGSLGSPNRVELTINGSTTQPD